jgi:hypothetical protein
MSVWGDITGAVEAPVKAAVDLGKGAVHGVEDLASAPVHAVEDMGSGAVHSVEDVVSAPVHAASDLISGHPLQAVGDLVEAPLKATGDLVGGVAHGAADLVEAPFKAAGDVLGGAWHGVEDLGQGIFDELKAPFDAAAGLVGALEGGQSKAATAAKSAATAADKLVGDAANAKVAAGQAVLAEAGDFSSSDDILKAGQPGIDFFHAFFPLYQQAAQYVSGAKNTNLNLQSDIDNRYNESNGIELAQFRGDAQNLTTLLGQVQSSSNELSSSYGSLSGWTGSAASAASRYNQNLLGRISGFLGGSGGTGAIQAPAAITAAMTNIQSALKTDAGNVLKLYSGQCGGQSPDTIADNIRKASGDLGIQDIGGGDVLSGMLDVAKDAFVGGLLGGGGGGLIGGLVGAFTGGSDARNNIINQAKQQLQAVVQEFDAKKASFDGYITAVEQQINADYQTMLTGLAPLQTDPMQGVTDPGSFSSSGTATSSAGAPSPSGGGGSAGGGSAGGGAAGGGSTAPASFTPPPLSTPSTGSGATAPSSIPGATMPGAGTSGTTPSGATLPGSTLPGSTPGSTLPGSSLPGSGLPGSTGQTGSVQIQHGKNTITMGSPDSQGNVKMTVDDGSGTPKSYDVNFGKGATGTAGAAGGIGADGAQQIAPGPDGKAVIPDGNLTITTSQPNGAGGPVKMTVDDGTGSPQTYTVDSGTAAATNPLSPTAPGQSATPAWPTSATGATAAGGAGGGAALGGGAAHGGGGAAAIGALSPAAHASTPGQGGGSYSSAAVDQSTTGNVAQGGALATTGQAPGSAGGTPMMGGGMGGMGGGSQGGKDAEHKGSRWQTKGNLFENDSADRAIASFRGVLGADLPEQPKRGSR